VIYNSYFSDLWPAIDQVWASQLFYTYFYNHAHRLRLEKLLYLEPSKSPIGFFKPLLDPDGELKRPLHGRFGSEMDKNVTAICLTFNGHSPTDASVRSGVTVM
jgi:hypothetical protein